MRILWKVFLVGILLPASPAIGGLPDWLENQIELHVPDWARDAPLVVYYNEVKVTASRTEIQSRFRIAVKPLTTRGKDQLPLVAYQQFGQNFTSLGAWIVRPDGKVIRPSLGDINQFPAGSRYSFSMNKIHVLTPRELQVGDLIAWEFLLKGKPDAYFQKWWFGDSYPTLISRFGIKLPPQWGLRTSFLNLEEAPEPFLEEGYSIWEVRNQSKIDPEPLGLPVSDLLPTLLLIYGRGEDNRENERELYSWEKISLWYSKIVKSQTLANPVLKGEVARIVQDAHDQMEKIRKIAEFVQGVRYLDVAVGRSVAEPHPAPEVLKNRYGDCEDKSVLTIAMLNEIGIHAYPLLAMTKETGSVVPNFPSPFHFNHAIIGIKIPSDSDLPSTIEVENLGRLLVFDPVDTKVGFGDLPERLQGTQALLAHETAGKLLTLPFLSPESSRREGVVRISFLSDEDIKVKSHVSYTGGYSAHHRLYNLNEGLEKRKLDFQESRKGVFGQVKSLKLEISGLESPSEILVSELEYRIPFQGINLEDLKIVNTRYLETRAPILPDEDRTTPLRFDAGFQEQDQTIIEIPEGWQVAELPKVIKISSPAGDYNLMATEKDNSVVVDRVLTIRGGTVAPSKYQEVRKFFQQVYRGDSSGIPLEKMKGKS